MKPLTQILAITLCLLMAAPIMASKSDNKSKEANRRLYLYGNVDLISTLKFDYGKYKIVIKSVYPQLTNNADNEGIADFNDLAYKIVQDEVAQFKTKVKDNQPLQQLSPRSSITNQLYIDYAAAYVKSKHDHIISIRFSIQGYITGLGQPYHYHRVINYNLDANEVIELSDLFSPDSDYLSVLANYTNQALERRLQDKSKIAEGTVPLPDNFRNWNIKSNGLLISFGEDTVAPYMLGIQTVLVPYSTLESILASDSPILDCARHVRRCSNTTLLTGGFIDEA